MDLLITLAVVATAIIGHELAHAVAAKAVGHDVFEIHIGTGPSVGFHLGSTPVRIGLLPLGGHIQAGTRSFDGFRWRSAIVAGAGATANLTLAGIGILLGIPAMIAFNLFAVVANVWPGRPSGLGRPSSDGRVLWDLLRADETRMAEERSGWWVIEALRLHRAGAMDQAATVVSEGVAAVGETRPLAAVGGLVAFSRRDFAVAARHYSPLIADRSVDRRGRAGYAADAAWAAILSGEPALAASALDWSRFAERVVTSERRTCIRALAEIENGDPQVGVDLVARFSSPVADGVRAWAAVRSGATDVDERVAACRGGLAPDHPLRQRIEALVATTND